MSRRIIAAAAAAAAFLAFSLGAAAAHASAGPVLHRCHAPDLSLTVVQAGVAGGSAYYDLVFTSQAATACVLDGYPGVTARTAPRGTRIGRAAARNPLFPAAPVIVTPGGAAWAVLAVTNVASYPARVCAPVPARVLAVRPPGARDRLAQPVHGLAVCSRRRVHSLSVSPVRPSRRAL